MDDVVIVAALRTAVGKFGGTLAKVPAADQGAQIIKALLAKTGIEPGMISEVILGQVLTAGVGQNPARQALIRAGLPDMVPGMTINKVCGSGLKATHLATQAIRCGDADIVIAGGQENMSASPHVLNGSREGQRMGDWKMVDTMIVDGLWDVYNQYHMGVTAENVARKYGISREEQDEFAAASQNKAEAAQKAGKFKDEIVPIEIPSKKGSVVFDSDEYIKPGVTAESLAALRPAFDKDGSVTAGNASGINDGAAAVVMMSAKRADAVGPEAAGAHQGLFVGRRRSDDHGHGPGAGDPAVPEESRLEPSGPRPDGNQRSLRRAGDRGQPRNGLGHQQDQRQRRRDRDRPSDRRLRLPHPGDAAARDDPARRQARAWPACASAAGWGWRWRWSVRGQRSSSAAAEDGHKQVRRQLGCGPANELRKLVCLRQQVHDLLADFL